MPGSWVKKLVSGAKYKIHVKTPIRITSTIIIGTVKTKKLSFLVSAGWLGLYFVN